MKTQIQKEDAVVARRINKNGGRDGSWVSRYLGMLRAPGVGGVQEGTTVGS